MSVSKDSLINALRIFKTEIQNEMLTTIIDAIQAAGSSAATETETTEPEETYTATGLSISLSSTTVTVESGFSETVFVTVTSTNNGTYKLELSGDVPSWIVLSNNTVIRIAPPSSITTAQVFDMVLQATGCDNTTAQATLRVNVTTPPIDGDKE